MGKPPGPAPQLKHTIFHEPHATMTRRIGDAAGRGRRNSASVMQKGHPVPGVAQAAIQEGRYVGRLIETELKGRRVEHPFRYFDKGNMAVVGKNYAVLERGSLHK